VREGREEKGAETGRKCPEFDFRWGSAASASDPAVGALITALPQNP